jgi:signal transduction histidine kinase
MDPALCQPPKSLLFIDDDPGVIASLRQLFESDYRIYTASNSREGIRLYQEMQPDVVCLDLHLPDENGIETLRSIKQNNAHACVVILTGYSTPVARHESSRLGAADFLNKPFDGHHLKARMDELLFNKRIQFLLEKDQAFYEKASKSQQKLEEIDYASSGFLHDIASPLSALSVLSELLVDKYRSGDQEAASAEESKIAQLLKLNTDYMCALVEHWRAFAEPESLAREQVDVSEIVSHACFLVHTKISHKKIELVVQVTAKNRTLYVNRFALSRVLANLLMNAVEAIEREDGKIEVQVFVQNAAMCFVVRDNGKGIAVTPLEQIFEARHSSKSKGLGMGLFISKRVVEACQGTISVQSRPQGGTEFTIRIPLTS